MALNKLSLLQWSEFDFLWFVIMCICYCSRAVTHSQNRGLRKKQKTFASLEWSAVALTGKIFIGEIEEIQTILTTLHLKHNYKCVNINTHSCLLNLMYKINITVKFLELGGMGQYPLVLQNSICNCADLAWTSYETNMRWIHIQGIIALIYWIWGHFNCIQLLLVHITQCILQIVNKHDNNTDNT